MPMTLHEAFVPTARQVVQATKGVIAKAEAHCADKGVDPASLFGARLAPDMFPLPVHINLVCAHSAGAVAAAHAGLFAPPMAPPPADFAAMTAQLDEADAALAAGDPEALEAVASNPAPFRFGGREVPFTARNLLLSFCQPNLFFHATTFYAILRNQGVPLGKMDFMGPMRVGL